ncbi:hypothetical protein [Microvirga tunisiensis]|uniref:Virulence protein n=1 Tax=Microvirga tunisiensis TaxID=2108360 RepID=A0A5N7MWT8_9HYPH|nr:hypothetical protein [Microvirga tunisiensis]MPR13287.1 hypothetical protein [Microvirga tunisiensis]MPR31160.1 hypothetical protein [Microvirga tunisiensis]
MDRDRQQAREQDTLGHDGGGATGFTDLPSGALSEVAKRLTTDDPVETAKNLGNFKRVGRSARAALKTSPSAGEAVETSPAGAFDARLERLGTSAEALYRAAIPDNGFPEANLEDHRLLAERFRAIGPILQFQSAARKTATVDHILNLPETDLQADAINSMAKHLSDLDHVNRTRLVERAIEIFKQDGPANLETRITATLTLVSGHNHLNYGQKAQVLDAIIGRHDLAELYTGISEHVAPWENATSRSTFGHAVESQSSHLDKSIEAISDSATKLEADRAISPPPPRHLDAIHQVGKSINKAYNSARAELMASDRERDGHGR